MVKKTINEITGAGSAGVYKVPINLAPKMWKNSEMGAFSVPVSKYLSAELSYDSYDGHMDDYNQKEITKLENIAKKQVRTAKKFFSQNDEEGNPFNGYFPMGNPRAGTPKSVYKKANLPKKENEPVMKNKKISESIDNDVIDEDLAVWFGTKKKPKGSNQPKGPWVNICRKKEGGGHPPCGRPDADPKGYPKCRAAGVAAKMTDAQKKSACAQKRREEKKDTQTGKGQKPVMVSYKPKNESLRDLIVSVLREEFSI